MDIISPEEPALAEEEKGSPRRRLWLVPLVAFVVSAGTTIALFTVNIPYVSLSPGSATAVGNLIEVPADKGHPSEGEILFTTVSIADSKLIDAVTAWFDQDIELIDRERIYPPDTSRDQFRDLNLELMRSSERNAVVVALRKLGHEVKETGNGAMIVTVIDGAAASGHLKPGDTVVGFNGRPVTLSSELREGIRAIRPGDVGRFDVVAADGASRVEEIKLGEHGGVAFLGVELLTKDQNFSMPFDVDIDTGRVGGPSAGLAFALAILEKLTPEDLTGGRKVAVTGTIEIDGSVGDVGGVAQKTAAVRKIGADVFLVPPGEFEEAKAHADGDLEVIAVATLDEALAALGRLGGDVQALAPPTTSPPQ